MKGICPTGLHNRQTAAVETTHSSNAKFSNIKNWLVRFLVAFLTLECATMALGIAEPSLGAFAPAEARETGLSRYKNKKLGQVSPYEEQQRWKTYLVIGEIFDRLWRRPTSKTLLKKGNSSTFEKYPILQLWDRDGDGLAEFFVYDRDDASSNTMEFGSYFDLNGDDRTDWLVYYGGIIPTMTAKGLTSLIYHYHCVDTNGDGHFDAFIYEAIDIDGDGFPETGATAWLYDTNQDGLIDKAEHIFDGRLTPIEPGKDGALALLRFGHPDPSDLLRIGKQMPGRFFENIAHEIDNLSHR